MIRRCVYRLLDFLGVFDRTPIAEVKREVKTREELITEDNRLKREKSIMHKAGIISFNEKGMKLHGDLRARRIAKLSEDFTNYLLDIEAVTFDYDFFDLFNEEVYIIKIRQLDTYRYVFYIQFNKIKGGNRSVKRTEQKLIIDTQYLFDTLEVNADSTEVHTIAGEVRQAVRLYCEIQLGRLL